MIVASHLVFSTLKWGSNQIIQTLHYYAVPTSFSLPLVPHAPRLIINPPDARRSVIYKFLTMVPKNMFTRRECGRKSLEKALTVSKTFFKRFFTLNLAEVIIIVKSEGLLQVTALAESINSTSSQNPKQQLDDARYLWLTNLSAHHTVINDDMRFFTWVAFATNATGTTNTPMKQKQLIPTHFSSLKFSVQNVLERLQP